MIFGRINPEKIWHAILTDLFTSPVRCSYFTSTFGNPKKVIFKSIIHTYFWLCRLFQKKTVIHLPTLPENVTTLTCEKQKFFIWLKVYIYVAFFQKSKALKREPVAVFHRWLWKEPVVVCGNGIVLLSCHHGWMNRRINQSCIFTVVQVTKSLQDPLEVGNNLPGISDNVRQWGLEQKCF